MIILRQKTSKEAGGGAVTYKLRLKSLCIGRENLLNNDRDTHSLVKAVQLHLGSAKMHVVTCSVCRISRHQT